MYNLLCKQQWLTATKVTHDTCSCMYTKSIQLTCMCFSVLWNSNIGHIFKPFSVTTKAGITVLK